MNDDQKAIAPLEFLLRTCMPPQCDWVVDLCCGSGSGCVAALRMGFNVLGVDRSSTQITGTRKRLQLFLDREAKLVHKLQRGVAHAAAENISKEERSKKAKESLPKLIEKDDLA